MSVLCIVSGDYMLSIKFNDQHITNSPFAVRVERGREGPVKGSPAKRIDTAGYQVRIIIRPVYSVVRLFWLILLKFHWFDLSRIYRTARTTNQTKSSNKSATDGHGGQDICSHTKTYCATSPGHIKLMEFEHLGMYSSRSALAESYKSA